ncbi:Phosphatidylinositide phosphatase SAC1 [Thoreauomyces humboldtii]|nr:Phosphatidylinositide phosphatase SAC1 [Thoreauomyces humboldtii]
MPTSAEFVARDTFRLRKTRDGQAYIVESPVVAKTSNASKGNLSVSEAGVKVLTGAQVDALDIDDTAGASLEICGVVGIIDMLLGKYLIVATARTLAATIQAHKVWRITAASILPIGSATQVARRDTSKEKLAKATLDEDLLQSISEIANSGHLYYSGTYDITHSVQHNQLQASGKASETVIDDRYFFSKHLAQPLVAAGSSAQPWVMYTICGFAGTIDLNVAMPKESGEASGSTKTYKLTLISRLNRRRVGTRYVRRGLDFEGNTANNVEMEQIVFHEDYHRCKKISAFAQIRGSVPSVWGQDLNLAYKPELLIAPIDKPVVWKSCKQHYDDLKHQYVGEKTVNGGADLGKVICVNLLNVDGWEGRLTKVYEESVQRFRDDKVTYEEFPVNKWCKNGKFSNMDILLDRVRDRLVNGGWFMAEGNVPSFANAGTLQIAKLQTGIARVSCLDSLDRTNLTCSIFARYMLAYQVQASTPELPAIPTSLNGTIASDLRDPVASVRKAVEPCFKEVTNMWADSGDAVSLLYAGTGALKADVTRTGSWTVKGKLTDGINSLTRYYLNNFADGRRQDAYDLWTGKAPATQIKHLIETEGLRRAQRVQKPYVARGQGILGRIVPAFVIDSVEPLLQTATEYVRSSSATGPAHKDLHSRWVSTHLDTEGTPHSLSGLMVTVAKLYAPTQVASAVQFVIATVLFLYLLVLVRILGIQGQLVVNRPRLSVEYRTIYEQLD